MIAMELTKAAIWAVVFIVGGLIGWLVSGQLWPLLVAGALLAVSITNDVVSVRAARSYGYAERDRDLLVRHGRMIRRLSIVPYARMQFVDVTAGPLERLFRLATVRLHTAAAASDAVVPGLEPAEATRLRDRLAALGEDRGEGL
jgi:membrane protein YdbS with pleckstrin-like domain